MTTFADVEAVYRKWLFLDHDKEIIKALFGTLIGNKYDGVPLWLMIVGAPGSGKTAVVEGVLKQQDMILVSNLTPASLASGATGTGFLDELNNHIMVVPDFSTIGEMPKETCNMLYSFFRDAYDGHFTRITGKSSRPISWSGKFGFLGCTTHEANEKVVKDNGQLGERFLLIRVDIPDSSLEHLCDAAFDGAMSRSTMYIEIQDTVNDFLDNFKLPPVTLDPLLRPVIMNSAKALAWSRSPVTRNSTNREVEFSCKFAKEVPTRLIKQLKGMAVGLTAIGCTTQEIINIIHRIARDSIPLHRGLIIKAIASGITSKKGLSEYLNVAQTNAARYNEDLEYLGVVRWGKLELTIPELVEIYKEQP